MLNGHGWCLCNDDPPQRIGHLQRHRAGVVKFRRQLVEHACLCERNWRKGKGRPHRTADALHLKLHVIAVALSDVNAEALLKLFHVEGGVQSNGHELARCHGAAGLRERRQACKKGPVSTSLISWHPDKQAGKQDCMQVSHTL
jgi:hypothetical protein